MLPPSFRDERHKQLAARIVQANLGVDPLDPAHRNFARRGTAPTNPTNPPGGGGHDGGGNSGGGDSPDRPIFEPKKSVFDLEREKFNSVATKKPEVVKVSSDTQLRKLPLQIAQMIATRLKSGAESGGSTSAGQAVPPAGGAPGAPGGGTSGQSRGGGGDLQQLLGRLTAAPLADFQIGEAVMIVATGGLKDTQVMAITVLGGVEPLLQATTQEQASSILTPWSLSNSAGDAAPQ